MTPPPSGWVDEFNGIRTPLVGSATSLDELLDLVCEMKESRGIKLQTLAIERASLTKRLVNNNRSFYGPGPSSTRGACDC